MILNSAASVSSSMLNAVRVIASCVCIGASSPLVMGLMSKLIQYICFLRINYPPRLAEAISTWNTDIFSLSVPESIAENLVSEDIDTVFTDHGLDTTFLSNFWDSMMIIVIAIACWAASKILILILRKCTCSGTGIALKVFNELQVGALNFLVVQVYGGFGDVIFFTVLEMKSLLLTSTWSRVSFAASIIFMIIGICFLCLYWKFLFAYHGLKSSKSEKSTEAIEQLERKYKSVSVLYEDFRDTGFFRHGFLFVLVARDVVISLIITLMPSFHRIQAILLCTLSVITCVCLILYNPFRERFERYSQLFSEVSVLIVYICILCLSIIDTENALSYNNTDRLAFGIMSLNTILICQCNAAVIWNIIQKLRSEFKAYREKKKRSVQAVRPETSAQNESGSTHIRPRFGDEDSSSDVSLFHRQSIVTPGANDWKISPSIAQEETSFRADRMQSVTPKNILTSYKRDSSFTQLMTPSQQSRRATQFSYRSYRAYRRDPHLSPELMREALTRPEQEIGHLSATQTRGLKQINHATFGDRK